LKQFGDTNRSSWPPMANVFRVTLCAKVQFVKNFRWFEKTEVSKGKVYGLLNRRTLFVWDSEVGDCLRRLDISESPPGMGESNLVRTFLLITSLNVKFHNDHMSILPNFFKLLFRFLLLCLRVRNIRKHLHVLRNLWT